jgi:hypothetical protein
LEVKEAGFLMAHDQTRRLKTIHNRLMKLSQSWAFRQNFDSELARKLRHAAILINHASYLESIPYYRKLAQDEGCTDVVDIRTIKQKMMLPDDIFKSYRQEWLDAGDFSRMDKWLSSLYYKRIDVDAGNINSIDDWITSLHAAGIEISYSSGTSGAFSFVPRSPEDWARSRTANTSYLTPMMTYGKTGTALTRSLLPPVMSLLSADNFARLVKKVGLHDFDGAFLGFRRGKMGNQALMQEMSQVFRRSYVLNDTDLNATALRCLRRGVQNDEEQRLVGVFKEEVVGRKEQNYLKILECMRKSTREGQKVFIFGAPYQFKELCEAAANENCKPNLKKESLVLFGGGWKSFDGEIMDRQSLVALLSETFGLAPDRILEGYSMTEISMLMLRCDAGRFHIPPVIEPVVFDEELSPLEGRDLSGTFGFLDPLAVSYPGFLISGDHVHMVDAECACGLHGPALVSIGRAHSSEVKGCGGIMSSLKA